MPHPYATDSDERRYVPFVLAVIAVAVALGFSSLLKLISFELPAWVDGPSTMALYGLLYVAFRKHLWKLGVFRRVGFVKVPSVHGQWDGYTQSSFDGDQHKVEVRITQDWTHMLVTLKGAHSKSRSVAASLLICDTPILAYEFENEPLPSARETMHAHRGYARLELSADGHVLNGDYYSGRDRQTLGSIHLVKVARRRSHRS
ncbi:MAG: hypothetical protein M3R69_07180 [Acidobacteriota bacterium]|nr:hypothetical protein [Acidobacteriota bacterium]